VALLPSPAFAQSIEITDCETLLGNNRGHLSADLNCTGSSSFAVTMLGHSELDLRGHTITSDLDGIECTGHCSIVISTPGGSIVGTGASPRAAIDVRYGASVKTEGVLLSGFRVGIIDCPSATLIDSVLENMSLRGMEHVWNVHLIRSSVRNNNGTALYLSNRLNAVDSDISNNTEHAFISTHGRVVLIRSSIVDNGGHGIGCDFNCDLYPYNGVESVKAVDSEISRNGWTGIDMEVLAGRVKLIRTTVADNGGAGITVVNNEPEQRCKITVVDSAIASNAFDGVRCESANRVRMSLRRSSATANGTDATCGASVPCSDLDATEAPRLFAGATCDTSHVSGSGLPGQTWGICSLDRCGGQSRRDRPLMRLIPSSRGDRGLAIFRVCPHCAACKPRAA